MAMGISVTDRAAARINELIAAESRDGQGLRVKVVGGGCSGLQYKVDFDVPKASDKVFETRRRQSFGGHEELALFDRHRARLQR